MKQEHKYMNSSTTVLFSDHHEKHIIAPTKLISQKISNIPVHPEHVILIPKVPEVSTDV
jgi:hypothetical protein